MQYKTIKAWRTASWLNARELTKIKEAENNYSDDTVTETQNRQKK